MRRILTLLFSLVLGSSLLAQNGNLTIKVSLTDSLVVDQAYMLRVDLSDLESTDAVIDTIKLKDGKGVFSGKIEDFKTTPIGLLKLEGAEDAIVALEEGSINVTLGNRSEARGTALNDTLYAFRNNSVKIEERLKDLTQKLRQQEGVSDEEKANFMKEASQLSNQLRQHWLSFIKNNIDNSAGQFFALVSMQGIPTEDFKKIAKSAPEDFQNNTRVISHLASIAAAEEAQGIGKPYKDITLPSLDGVNISLSNHIGKKKLVLIDFWASWCGPCIREMPTLVEAYKQYKDKGFEIVGISLDNSKDAWASAVKRLNMDWVHMSDLKGWESEAAVKYGIQSIPQTILVDEEGKVIAANLRGEALLSKINELLN